MTDLTLVRHGQTNWNLDGRWQGHADVPLNNAGREQAQQLADLLRGRRFDAIYASDLQRARDTAAVIANHLDLLVKTHKGLRELNMGDWEGRLASEIPVLFPEAWADRQQHPLDALPPNGESLRQLSQRVIPSINAICAQYPSNARLLIVSHGLSLAVFLCHARKRPLEEAYDCIPQNATPLQLEWTQDAG